MVTGTLVNYYIHCKRQCWLHGNRVNLEDNSEEVKIGKVLHEEKAIESKQTEVMIDQIRIDKITKEYLIEIKKSDSDQDAAIWQTLYYLKKLKDKGVQRKGKIEFIEKKKANSKTIYVQLDKENEAVLNEIEISIQQLLQANIPKEFQKISICKKCAYFTYCHI